MAMNEQQMGQVLAWFHDRVGAMTCSVCSHTEFKFDSELTAVPVWRNDPRPHLDLSDNVVAVMQICTHCASVRLFSAARMGILPATPRDDRIAAATYSSVLVPLDRSPVAELALQFAVAIAQRGKTGLELVAVHRSYVFDNPHAANAWALKLDSGKEAEILNEEQDYLADTAKRVTTGSSLSATTTVLSGSVVDPSAIADRILEQAHLKRADLIVMTTRSRGLVTRLGLGSVADELIRRAHVPVLLISHGDQETPSVTEPVLDNFLIPLDGSVLSEQILVPALGLASLMHARCTLLRVIAPESGTQEEKQAEHYLDRVAETPRQQGLQVQARVVMSSHPVEAILSAARTQKSNLIALATHGYGGFKRLVLGSVADKIVRHTPLPVLIHSPIPKG